MCCGKCGELLYCKCNESDRKGVREQGSDEESGGEKRAREHGPGEEPGGAK